MKVLQLLHSSHIFHCYMANNIYVFPPSEADSESGRTVFSFLKHLFLCLLFFSYISLLRYIWRHIHLGIHKKSLYEAHHLQGHSLIPITFWGEGPLTIIFSFFINVWLTAFATFLLPSLAVFSRFLVPGIFHSQSRENI